MKKLPLCLLSMLVLPVFTTCKKNDPSDSASIPSVKMCTQIWMLNNLMVTNYKNGDTIPQVTDLKAWSTLTTGAWCYYDNNSANGTVYGKLYNWYAVNDSRGLAPAGWHIPSDAEWTVLENCLGGATVAGGALKETGTAHWMDPNTGATNSSGFTGLGAGYHGFDGQYVELGITGIWWSSTQYDAMFAWPRYLSYGYDYINRNFISKQYGFSVRCVRD